MEPKKTIELKREYGKKSIPPIIEKIFAGEKPKSIFEVGCGTGLLYFDYVYLNKIELVGGFDIEPLFIKASKLNYPMFAGNFFIWDANKTPWPLEDNSIDIIFTVGTLLIMLEPIPILREMLRIGKKVIIAEFQDKNENINKSDSVYTYRIKRDYTKLFKELGVAYKIKGEDSGKTIFEITK